ncbi:hypothetical protein F5050DRAFT_1716873 [Lentinula boryana]|uniref:Uncharacterized protein n=1 Tax=Lentinula boryana TaxID=40481 RepID=A0ABQ8QUV6_9AGAR|nr:hypothetical protein F5050DRAFT_1716873 [Lentinula boryana]
MMLIYRLKSFTTTFNPSPLVREECFHFSAFRQSFSMYLKFAFLALATSLFSVDDPTDLFLEFFLLQPQAVEDHHVNNHNDIPKAPQGPPHGRKAPRPGVNPLRVTFRQTRPNLPVLDTVPDDPDFAYDPKAIVDSFMQQNYYGSSSRELVFDNEYQALDRNLIWFRVKDDVYSNPCYRSCFVTADWRHVQSHRIPSGVLDPFVGWGESYPSYNGEMALDNGSPFSRDIWQPRPQ